MNSKTTLPPDAVPIPQAAKLLNLHPERVRQLIKLGFATSPARGQVGLAGLLRGYATYLRSEADRPESEAAARAHAAKADLVSSATDRRRAELMLRAEAEVALRGILDIAIFRLREMAGKRALRGLPSEVHDRVKAEVSGAISRITAAHAAAVEALATGDLTAIEGAT